MNAGWIGTNEELMFYLSTVGADQDDGKYLIYNRAVVSFMGMGEDMVVPAETQYSVDGHRCNLAAGLNSTSYGLAVGVF